MRSWAEGLRERVAFHGDESGGLTDPRVAARFLGAAFTGGSSIAFASLLLPQPDGTDMATLATSYGAGLVTGMYLLARRNRATPTEIAVALFAGTLMISLGIYGSAQRTGVFSIFYLWIALEAVFFLSRRAAALQLVLIGIGFGVVLAARPPAGATEHWVVTVGTILLVSAVVDALKSHAERTLRRMSETAQTDPLTGLFNRRGFQRALESELGRAERTGRPASLMVADLDHFKRVNDRLGHPGGDAVLKRFAGQMDRITRDMDVCARLGGEEFAVILPESSKQDALLVSERLRRTTKAAFADTPAPITVSIGVACFPGDGDTANDVLLAGDQALYAAKQLGRDRTVLFSEDVDIGRDRRGDGSAVAGQLTAVLVLAETLDIRDCGTAQHSQRVGRYARAIAEQLGLGPAEVDRLALAGVLHDVGKIGVGDTVLQKPAPLDEDEWAQMRRHPELGARILAGAELEDVAEWVFAHHERVDGTGYPLGLCGEQIPLEARILAVADAYEAMTSDRPYSRSVSAEEAAVELRRCAGTQFDERVVEALLAGLPGEQLPAHVAGAG
jgi:diguanylate cyclase (GGDEF)-like protein